MKIASLDLYGYELPFKAPYMFRRRAMSARQGLLARIITDEGIVGFGDIAPFPGLNAETLLDVTEEALRVARSLTGCTVPRLPGKLADRFERWLFAHYLSPSLSFGLQAALLDIHARSEHKALAKYLNPEAADRVPVNALITGNMKESVQQAEAIAARGISTVKIKVGKDRPKNDAEKVRVVHDVLGPNVRLRLDANRAWDFEEALTFASKVQDCAIEYIEEPLKDPTRLVAFSGHSGIPCALDETIVEQGWEHLERWRGARAAILKPTVLGGFEVTLWMARRACNVGMVPVITSALESGVGISALAHFAAAVQPADVPAGLDTASLFQMDLLKKPVVSDDGTIELEHLAIKEDFLDWDLLTPIRV